MIQARPAPKALALALAVGLALASAPRTTRAQGAAAAARPRVTRPPELLEHVEAAYPPDALAAGTSATVVLELALSARGTVDAVVVVGSAGAAFDAAAADAARRFVFRPAEIDGKPAPVKLTYRTQFVPRVVAKTTATFRGVVVARGTGAPLEGVEVALAGVGTTRTDAAGAFAFDDVPPGPATVALARKDVTRVETEETFEAGRTLEARYDVEPTAETAGAAEGDVDDLEVVVTAPRLVKQVVSTEVGEAEARRVAGTQGDVLKVVENLPGVARATAGSGQLVVWGAAPQDTRTYVGAVRLPMLYHFGGLRSVVHDDRVASLELVPGGYGAAYGRGLGGLVQVTWAELPKDRAKGSLKLDALDASGAVAVPLGERVRATVTARRSHVRELGGAFTDERFEEFFTLPRYHDGQARLRVDLGPREYVEIGGLLSGDRQDRTQPSSDPARRLRETRTLSFERVDVAYRKDLDGGGRIDVAPWYGHDRAGRSGDFGGVPTLLETDAHLVGFRAEWRDRVAPAVSARAGFDFELVRSTTTRAGSITSPPREGDPYVFGRAPADAIASDRWTSTLVSAAPYGELDWTPFDDRLHVVPGARLEPYLVTVDRKNPHDPNVPDVGATTEALTVQPRLAARYAVSSRVTYKAAAGLYRQPPLADDLSAVFGNPLLGPSKGRHLVGGAEVKLLPALTVETTLFATTSEALVGRNPSETPRVGQSLLQEAEGRSFGAQLLLRKEKQGGRFFGWIAYTALKSERRDPGSERFRPFDFDQTHVFTALGSVDLGKGFEVGLRARLASGFPRTPVTGAYYDARRNRFEPTLGSYNADRIPLFFQLDARAAKRFRIGRTELEVYLDVQNVTNRENPEEIAYSPTYDSRRYVLGLPILPVAGARWSF